MAWDEARAWLTGSRNEALYKDLLDDATTAPVRNAARKKIVRPEDMPWEMSRQGLLKHLLNEKMNTRMETVDAYMQVIPPGSRSGKHRHLAEECLYVLEGFGYDLHQDCDVEITALPEKQDLTRRPEELSIAELVHLSNSLLDAKAS